MKPKPDAGAVRMLVGAMILFVWMAVAPATAVPLAASVDQSQGLPTLSIGGGRAMSSAFVFWGKSWAWANSVAQFKVVGPFEYGVSAVVQGLNLDLVGHISKLSERQLVWSFDLNAAETKNDVIGGGISFQFDLANFASQLGEPSLLPGNRGWSWGRSDSARVEMRFDPPLADVHFEAGQKEIRALFFNGVVPKGKRHYVATLTLAGDATVIPTLAERFGVNNDTDWPAKILDWRRSPVDLSFLNSEERPAGKHGFVKAVGGHLLFGDGTPARFWGTNVVAYSLFATKSQEAVRDQAKRLSELGFNLVRLHHIDSDWVQPNIFGTKAPNTQKLNDASLEKLDWWIKCLEDEGIYIWLDLDDGRRLTAGDKIDNFAEISKGKPTVDLWGFNYLNASIEAAMQGFNAALLNHVNRYTGRRYKDDPGIMAILITNENDVTNHFGSVFLPDKNVPHEEATYMARSVAFAEKYGLPKNEIWQSWLPGPSKLFLNDLEHQFNTRMIRQLRALGVRSLIVTTDTWGDNPLSSLPSLTDGEIIDVHSYGGVGALEANPLFAANLVDWIAAAQVVNRPLSATEWGVEPFTAPDRDALPLYVAGTADLQGWNALMQFAYSQEPLDRAGRVGAREAYNDPSWMATLPAAALLYRRQDAKEADTTYVFAPTPQQLFDQTISPDNSVALRTAAAKGKLMIAIPSVRELPWLKPSPIPAGAKVFTDQGQAMIASDADEAVSDTGQLTRNWKQGTYTIDTPRTQAAMGWIGGKKIALSDVECEITTRNATVAVQSLDGNPISTAGALIISLGAPSTPANSDTTFRSEPVVGELTIRARKGLKFYRRDGGVQLEIKLPVSYADNRYRIRLKPDLGTYWLLMK